ncbi:Uncharacterised protein [Sphingobacterium multivorum]|uniref:Uncharacterized protein n=2 Tax=Sphingobacterium multivorum TaxID=28454 RepID=A0A2X2JXE2_SPHMU|nr:Uncharacterised protein [Sphingobacterium multivorum]
MKSLINILMIFFIALFRMKKLLAICFLTIYIASATEISQLLRFPLLIEHYFEHKVKNPSLSVVDFLNVHYSGYHLENHPHDDDYEKDQKLPFMMHTTHTTLFLCAPKLLLSKLKIDPYPKKITIPLFGMISL